MIKQFIENKQGQTSPVGSMLLWKNILQNTNDNAENIKSSIYTKTKDPTLAYISSQQDNILFYKS